MSLLHPRDVLGIEPILASGCDGSSVSEVLQSPTAISSLLLQMLTLYWPCWLLRPPRCVCIYLCTELWSWVSHWLYILPSGPAVQKVMEEAGITNSVSSSLPAHPLGCNGEAQSLDSLYCSQDHHRACKAFLQGFVLIWSKSFKNTFIYKVTLKLPNSFCTLLSFGI